MQYLSETAKPVVFLPLVNHCQMWHMGYKYTINTGSIGVCTLVLIYTHFMSGPLLHPQAISPQINTITLQNKVWALSKQSVSLYFNTSKTIKTLCMSSSLAFLAIGRSLLSLIPADKCCIKRTDEGKQNKHNRNNAFLLLLVSPSDKCWAHRVASWHACLCQPY